MSGADVLVDGFPHGTPEGYRLGCRSNGGCLGKANGLSCVASNVRYHGDFTYRGRVDAGLSAAEILALDVTERDAGKIAERAAREAERVAAREADRLERLAVRARLAKPKAVKKPKPKAKQVITRPVAPTVVPPAHGTAEGYWAGCFTNACPVSPSCADVNLAALNGDALLPVRPVRAKAPTIRERRHGTQYVWQQGCRTVENCPNTAAGLPSCTDVNRAYHRGYSARRRAGFGPALKHGTATGYQMGCMDRETCPGDADGLSCSDASLAAERRRRREKGIPEVTEKVPSGPVLEHLALLRSKGMGVRRIAEAAGVPKTFVRVLVDGRQDYVNGTRGPRFGAVPKQVDAVKAEKVLAVPAVERVRVSTVRHGTRMGYRYLECRSRTECPSVVAGGKSCTQVVSEYQRGLRDRAKARAIDQARSAA